LDLAPELLATSPWPKFMLPPSLTLTVPGRSGKSDQLVRNRELKRERKEIFLE